MVLRKTIITVLAGLAVLAGPLMAAQASAPPPNTPTYEFINYDYGGTLQQYGHGAQMKVSGSSTSFFTLQNYVANCVPQNQGCHQFKDTYTGDCIKMDPNVRDADGHQTVVEWTCADPNTATGQEEEWSWGPYPVNQYASLHATDGITVNLLEEPGHLVSIGNGSGTGTGFHWVVFQTS